MVSLGVLKIMPEAYLNHMLATIISKYWKLILIFTVVGASASLGLSLSKKTIYVAESRLLIRYIQTQGVDAYAASRAAGKIAQIFSEVSKTDLFLDKVMATPFAKKLDIPFKDDPVARKEFWDNTISVTTGIDSAMLTVKAFSENPNDPKPYVEAVSNVFLTSGEEFHGADGLVSVKLVDGPIVYKKSILPTLIMNCVGGLFLGCLIGFLIASLFVAIQSLQNSQSKEGSAVGAKNVVARVDSSPKEHVSRNTENESPRKSAPKNDRVDAVPVSTSISSQEREASVPEQQAKSDDRVPSEVEYHLSKSSGPLLRTVFDDMKRLGLDPKQLTLNS